MTNTRLLDALHCRNKGPVPVWLMRQAGRYMPEYRALRQKYTFLEMCHQPELILEVTKLPLTSFGMDAAILFSDILVIPEALDVGLRFEDHIGPIIERPLSSAADVANLPKNKMSERLDYVAQGIKLLKKELKVPLIGFCGAPFTVASYMIEGKSSRDLRKTKQWMLRDPTSFHQLLTHLAECSIDYLNMQIAAGVQAIQIFDSWAGLLAHPQFREFSLHYLDKILKGIKAKVPVIIFCKGCSSFIADMASLKPQAISLDWSTHLGNAKRLLPSSIALQGNLDPDILYAPSATIKKEVLAILDEMRDHPGYIFNLGHGLTPGTPVDAVKLLVECVQNYR